MNTTINRNAMGEEDIAFGLGTVEQTRSEQTVVIQGVNADSIPYDATYTVKGKLDTVALDPLTTRGDIAVRGISATVRLPIGANGYVLSSDGTDIVWSAAPSGGVTDHTALTNIGVNTHAQIDTHIADDTKHRIINDAGTTVSELFSASKIIADLSGKSDTSHNHAGVYEPADATILKDADIGVNVEAYDATILKDADIGVTVEAYDATITKEGSIFNGNEQLVKTNVTGQLPAIDGSQLLNLPSGFADPMTTRGDVIVRNNLNVTARLPLGTAGQSLVSDGLDLAWATPAGGGDMLKATYDPTSINGSAFDTDNHIDGTTNKVYTATEKTKLAGIETAATADQTGAEIKVAYELEADTNAFTDAEKLIIGAGSTIGVPTHVTNIQIKLDHLNSSGITDGCAITDNLDGTINIAAGETYIRAVGGDGHSELFTAVVPAINNLVMNDNATNYVYISYNDGINLVWGVSTSPATINLIDIVPAYVVIREGTNLNYQDTRNQNVDHIARAQAKEFYTGTFARKSGGVISDAGTLHLACTEGAFYFQLNETAIPALDTTGVDTFELYSHTAGVWGEADVSVFDNANYDNGTDLVALGANKYGVHWVYAIASSNSPHYAVLYGTAEYGSLLAAQAATAPSSLPTSVAGLGILLGRVITQNGTAEILEVATAFETTFNSTLATNHEELSGLLGGAAADHNHLTTAQVALVDGSLQDADIGVTVQAYSASNALTSDITYENLSANGDVGTSAGQLAIGNHTHTGVYEPADATILKDADIGVTVEAYDVDNAKTDVVQAFTASQSGVPVVANTGAINLALGNNWSITPGANVTIQNPSNIVAGQSGDMFVDATTYTISFGTYYKFAGTTPTLSGNCVLGYYVKSATEIIISEVNGYA